MSRSLSRQLQELSDPRPTEFHPDQEDWDEFTSARVSQSRTYHDEGEVRKIGVATARVSSSKPRKRTAQLEFDPRYAGKPVSRRELYSCVDEEEVDELEADQSDDEQVELEGDTTSECDPSVHSIESSNEEELATVVAEDEGEMDRGGVSALAMDRVQEDIEKGHAVRQQIRLWDGVLEGRIKLHKSLCLTNSLPQAPHLPVFLAAGGDKATSSIEQVRKQLSSLLDSLLHLQHNMLLRHRATRGVVGNDAPLSERSEDDSVRISDEDIPSDSGSSKGSDCDEEAKDVGTKCKRKKRKRRCPWRVCGYEEHISALHTAFEGYRDDTISKWDTKLRLASGRLTDKAFVQVDRSTLAQIKHVLQDKDRLIKRTQLKRSVYHVLGKEDGEAGEEVSYDSHLKSHDSHLKLHDSHLKLHDEEIYDEDDFYHQLLRDLIERKMNYTETADPVAMGRQWLALQKLRSKAKKKVDTKASKGRKIRYNVHPKLVGFMAPVERGTMTHTSRNDLFLSLFGGQSLQTHKNDL